MLSTNNHSSHRTRGGSDSNRRVVPALTVRQWLEDWDDIDFDEQSQRRRPEPVFYLFSLSV